MTTTIDRSGSQLEERGRPNLKPDERRTGGAAMHAASAAGRTAKGDADDAHLADDQAGRTDTTNSDDGAQERPGNGSVGQNLPPLPRPVGRALASGRTRAGTLERLAPSVAAVMVAIAVAIAATIALTVMARSRRRGPAEELVARLQRVPKRIAA